MNTFNYLENKDRPLYSLTVAEFEELLNKHQQASPIQTVVQENDHHLLKGVKELADFLGTSISTAQRIKATGILIPATMQQMGGRTCLFDVDKVRELLQSHSAVIRYKKHNK